MLIRHKCPICKNEKNKNIFSISYKSKKIKKYLSEFYNGMIVGEDLNSIIKMSYTLKECVECKFIYQEHILDERLNKKLYEIWCGTEVSNETKKKLDRYYYKRLACEINYISTFFQKPSSEIKVLDFGMGWGRWALMAKAHGMDVHGYEISIRRIEEAEKNGIIVIDNSRIPNGDFDIINCDNVLEHVADPGAIIEYLCTGLKIGGIIKIAVPYKFNIRSKIRKYGEKSDFINLNGFNQVAPLEHINYYSKKTFETLAKRANLVVYEESILNQYANNVLMDSNFFLVIKHFLRPIARKLGYGNYIFLKRQS